MRVRAPGSTANLGSGFDAAGLAVGLHLEVDTEVGDAPALAGAGSAAVAPAEEGHPAVVAFRAAGGAGPLAVRSAIPAARGLGFSGAARVAGAFAGRICDGVAPDQARSEAFAIAAELEGHADNVAASAFGGFVVTAGGRVVTVPLGRPLALVVWIPSFTTSTRRARATLSPTVSLEDAVFNVGRAALLVAALATGDVDGLRTATEDRLHQDARLEAAPSSRLAMEALLAAGAWAAWLSGSGPTVAAFADPARAESMLAGLPADGEGRVLEIDHRGVEVVPDDPSRA